MHVLPGEGFGGGTMAMRRHGGEGHDCDNDDDDDNNGAAVAADGEEDERLRR